MSGEWPTVSFTLMLNRLVCRNISMYPNDKRVLQKSSTFSIIIGSWWRKFNGALGRSHAKARLWRVKEGAPNSFPLAAVCWSDEALQNSSAPVPA
jgi:hypothetical protein